MFNWTIRTFALLIFIGVFSMFILLLDKEAGDPVNLDRTRSAIPEFNLDSLNRDFPVTSQFFSELEKDTIVVMNVWASWCISCAIEHPFLMELESAVNLIGLNYKDDRDDAKNWLLAKGDPYEFSIHDPNGTFALDLGVSGAPETFLIVNNEVVLHYVGIVNQNIWMNYFDPMVQEIFDKK